jgi:hypothetical protein
LWKCFAPLIFDFYFYLRHKSFSHLRLKVIIWLKYRLFLNNGWSLTPIWQIFWKAFHNISIPNLFLRIIMQMRLWNRPRFSSSLLCSYSSRSLSMKSYIFQVNFFIRSIFSHDILVVSNNDNILVV